MLALQWLSVQSALAYVLPGAIVWFGMLRAGVHPALAGVLLGLLTPATAAFGRGRRVRERPALDAPVVRVEAMLHPYVAFGIMPLFALANAGVSLEGVEPDPRGWPAHGNRRRRAGVGTRQAPRYDPRIVRRRPSEPVCAAR